MSAGLAEYPRREAEREDLRSRPNKWGGQHTALTDLPQI
jgi:hypothetical protein